MNQEIKEQFVKKILKNHIMWSGSEETDMRNSAATFQNEYLGMRREQEVGSFEDFRNLCDSNLSKAKELMQVWEDEFTAITYEAASRWQEALIVMGL